MDEHHDNHQHQPVDVVAQINHNLRSNPDSLVGYVSAPSSNTRVMIDVAHTPDHQGTLQPPRVLGRMILTAIQEDNRQVLAIGQIVKVTTYNQWHSNISFKGVIKQHGRIPHLSGSGDIREASVNIQSAFVIGNNGQPVPYVLGISPTTGEAIYSLDNQTLKLLIQADQSQVVYLGKAYGAQVSLPFHLKHFGVGSNGSNEAYHIGIFGRTGSGKSVMAAMMLLGYAKNKDDLSILILDPQGQFYHDKDLLPNNHSFRDMVSQLGMHYQKYRLVDQIYLSDLEVDNIPELLQASGFIKETFLGALSDDKSLDMIRLIARYLQGRYRDPRFSLATVDSRHLLIDMLTKFTVDGGKPLEYVYITQSYQYRLRQRIEEVLNSLEADDGLYKRVLESWSLVLGLYKRSEERRYSVDEIVAQVTDQVGNCVVLNLASLRHQSESDNLQGLFIAIIQKHIVSKAAKLYEDTSEESKTANTLVVMDEAHRFAARAPAEPRMKDVSKRIVDAVRTTRKYGVGYMFITQSLDSLDEEVSRQTRIFGFGYGLTMGHEFRRVRDIVNNPSALGLYQSFIDPGSSNTYPFMFYGPVSPLSFTGAPVFIEAYNDFGRLYRGLHGEPD